MEDPYPFSEVFRPSVTCANATAVLEGAQLLGGEGRARLHKHWRRVMRAGRTAEAAVP